MDINPCPAWTWSPGLTDRRLMKPETGARISRIAEPSSASSRSFCALDHAGMLVGPGGVERRAAQHRDRLVDLGPGRPY